MDVESQLRGSPYVIETDDATLRHLADLQRSATETRHLAIRATASLRSYSADLLSPYYVATRADLVTESNGIEGYVWDPTEVRATIDRHFEVLQGPELALIEMGRAEKKLYQVLGLYKAHAVAESWSASEDSPRASHIREFHRLILGAAVGSGSYKLTRNWIAGREDHITTSPIDVPREMNHLVDWWQSATGDPLLTATVIHAWIAHMHPFSDGNGRLARVLANLELSRYGYAPLIVTSQSDRGEYYSALKDSDDGNILPLFKLFERVIRRQADLMASPSYAKELVNDNILTDKQTKFSYWSATLNTFTQSLENAAAEYGWVLHRQGELSLKSFSFLWSRSDYGNGWYVTLGRNKHRGKWLLWFGFKTDEWLAREPTRELYPSIHISKEDERPDARHRYTWEYLQNPGQPMIEELSLIPLEDKPVQLRYGSTIKDRTMEDAAREILVNLIWHSKGARSTDTSDYSSG